MKTIGVTVSNERRFPNDLLKFKDKFRFKSIEPEKLQSSIADCDILYLWSLAYRELDDVINSSCRLPDCIYVARQGGDEWLKKKLSSRSTKLYYAKGAFSKAIAEYTLASLFMLSKNLHVTAIQNDWRKYSSDWIFGSRALILGRGDIALNIKLLFEKVGIHSCMIGRKDVRNISRKKITGKLGVYINDTDHVICCLPSERGTQNILNFEFFSDFTNINFVNISRGEVLDTDGLLNALDKNFVRAAVLDVFKKEPLEKGNLLWGDKRVIVSPHQSYRTHDWEEKLHRCFMEYLTNLM